MLFSPHRLARIFFYSAFLLLVLVGAMASVSAQTVPSVKMMVGAERPEPPLRQVDDMIPDWLAWLELARLQSYVEEYDDSLASYARVLREKPDHVQARLERAKVLTWAGRSDEAWEDLQTIPESALDAESRLILADLHVARQEYDAALVIYSMHLEQSPENDLVRLKLAEVLSWAGRYPESLEQYELLIQNLPEDAQLRRKYAFVLSWAGRHQDAIRELQQALP